MFRHDSGDRLALVPDYVTSEEGLIPYGGAGPRDGDVFCGEHTPDTGVVERSADVESLDQSRWDWGAK